MWIYKFADDDAQPSDLKNAMHLIQCFLIYTQIVLHFINPAIQMDLTQAFLFYVDRLFKHASIRTWESVRNFHFIFHKSCLARGVDDPAVWRTVDPNRDQ